MIERATGKESLGDEPLTSANLVEIVSIQTPALNRMSGRAWNTPTAKAAVQTTVPLPRRINHLG